ncbi:hypothetical protein Hdeb2414_s0021g00575341 [Helianthus debilis subsp. tardiflorus]
MVHNHHTVVCYGAHNRIHRILHIYCSLRIHLHPHIYRIHCIHLHPRIYLHPRIHRNPRIHLHPRIRNPDTIAASGNMVHLHVHSQHRIHFVARTEIYTVSVIRIHLMRRVIWFINRWSGSLVQVWQLCFLINRDSRHNLLILIGLVAPHVS